MEEKETVTPCAFIQVNKHPTFQDKKKIKAKTKPSNKAINKDFSSEAQVYTTLNQYSYNNHLISNAAKDQGTAKGLDYDNKATGQSCA